MKSLPIVALVAQLVAPACQKADGGGKDAITEAYASDIATICDAYKLSGADKDPGGQLVIVANYLAAHLKTDASRAFMIRIQPLTGEPRAKAFEDEARRVGLGYCQVADILRQKRR